MADRTPLDLRIEIADLFDRGALIAPIPFDEIAARVGATRRSVNNAIQLLNFAIVEKRNRLMQSIPARLEPPRRFYEGRFPNLNGRSSQTTHAVLDLFKSGRVAGRCSAEEIAEIIDVSPESAGRCLKALGFKVVRRQKQKHVGWKSEIVSPPYEWPDLFRRQRDLRRSGLSASAVISATDAAAGVEAIIQQAIQRLDVSDIPLNKRGMLKANIKAVIRDVYREAVNDSIPRRELARWIGESAEANVAFLENRVKGLVKFQSRRESVVA